MSRYITKILLSGVAGGLLYGSLREHKKIIVFDVDNTLVHAKLHKRTNTLNMNNLNKCDFSFTLKNENDNDKKIGDIYDVWQRPYVNIIIPLLSNFTTIHIFTSAEKTYADNILNNMKINKYFNDVLYEDSWQLKKTKDLGLVSGDNKNKILVDDRKFNNGNDGSLFYHIPSYRVHDKYDYELVKYFFKWMIVL